MLGQEWRLTANEQERTYRSDRSVLQLGCSGVNNKVNFIAHEFLKKQLKLMKLGKVDTGVLCIFFYNYPVNLRFFQNKIFKVLECVDLFKLILNDFQGTYFSYI